MKNKYKYLIIILLIATSLAAFGRILANDFTNFDDTVYVTTNQHVQNGLTWEGLHWALTDANSGFWHPLTWLSLMLDYQLYGLKAGGYHMTSLMLHILTTLLLFWLFHRMTGAIWRSAFVAALFAIHPLHVESVAWIAERKDTLSGFFWMLTLCLYVYYTEKPVFQRYLIALLSFACGLMSKSMLVTLPVIMILMDYWPLQRLRQRSASVDLAAALPVSNNDNRLKTKAKKGVRKKNVSVPVMQKVVKPKPEGIIPLWQLKEKFPFFLLSIIFMVVTFYAQHQKDYKTFSLDSRILNALVSCITYLINIFYPLNLAVFYPFPAQIPAVKVFTAVILLLMITTAVILAMRRLPYFVVGWFWFLVTLLPVIGIIQVGKHALADRYMYLSSIGISIMLAWGMPHLFKCEDLRRKILIPAALAVILVLSVLTWRQCGYWKNSIELFSHTINVTENNYLAHTNLGIALAASGDIDQAVFHYQAALQIQPDDSNAHFNLANALQKQGKTDEAIAHYREAVKSNPNYSRAHNNLGVYLEAQGLRDEAIAHYLEALRIEPNNPGLHFNLGIALGRKGNLKAAIEHLREAIYLKPDYEEARRMLKLALDIQQRQNR